MHAARGRAADEQRRVEAFALSSAAMKHISSSEA